MNNSPEILAKYKERFGDVRADLGYSLTIRGRHDVWIVTKWYERNNWSSPEIEHEAFYSLSGEFLNDKKYE